MYQFQIYEEQKTYTAPFIDKAVSKNGLEYLGMLRRGLKTLFFVFANEKDDYPMNHFHDVSETMYVFFKKEGHTTSYIYLFTYQGLNEINNVFTLEDFRYKRCKEWTERKGSVLFTSSSMIISEDFFNCAQSEDKQFQLWKDIIIQKYLLPDYKSAIDVQNSLFVGRELDEAAQIICREEYIYNLNQSIEKSKPVVLESTIGSQLFSYIKKDTHITIFEDEMLVCIEMKEE